MRTFRGITVSQGIVLGKCFVLASAGFHIPKRYIQPGGIEDEIKRLLSVIEQAKEDIAVNRDSTAAALGQTFANIFEAQLLILQDEKLLSEIKSRITNDRFTAVSAVSDVIENRIRTLRKIEFEGIAEKANDVKDIEKRLLRLLLGEKKELLDTLKSPVILMANNLTPSETANFDKRYIKAIVTEEGGVGGHTAILASALDIPCVVGAGSFLDSVSTGDFVIVDAGSGAVIVNPDEASQNKYRLLAETEKSRVVSLTSFRGTETITTDGVKIEVFANIEFPHEVENVLERGAEGIGLFRSEFLFLTQESDPTEEEHFNSYRHAAESMNGKPVIIRTFDFGDDKVLDRHTSAMAEHNPALGLRGIRLALQCRELFLCQLRAILRASIFGDIRVMFPMISTVQELLSAKIELRNAEDELRHNNIPFRENIPVGMMVEVPSVVVMLDHFAEHASFFSIGTNDLIQYTMAVDRGNRNVNQLFNAEDPAVLRLIQKCVLVSKEKNIPLSLCGQMASIPQQAVLLAGLGVRSISCTPSAIGAVKRMFNSISVADCEKVTNEAMKYSQVSDVKQCVKYLLDSLMPDIFRNTE
ncbi:phosphoenolpyruvate-protein phosphotransferase [Planctomycetales bacterium]|nr:phosphoenolpyruvate-protein phosphotransferase [Planctomycetales bacterium]